MSSEIELVVEALLGNSSDNACSRDRLSKESKIKILIKNHFLVPNLPETRFPLLFEPSISEPQ